MLFHPIKWLYACERCNQAVHAWTQTPPVFGFAIIWHFCYRKWLPRRKGPCASYQDIGAMCFALEEFCCLVHLPEFPTCTDQLQQWNRPRPKKLEGILVANFCSRRDELLKKVSRITSVSAFDPRQREYRNLGGKALEKFRYDLQAQVSPVPF